MHKNIIICHKIKDTQTKRLTTNITLILIVVPAKQNSSLHVYAFIIPYQRQTKKKGENKCNVLLILIPDAGVGSIPDVDVRNGRRADERQTP